MEGATTRTVLNNFPRNWVSLFMTGPGVVIYKDFFFQFNHRNSNIAVQASNTAMRAQAMINRYISTGSHVKAYHGELTATQILNANGNSTFNASTGSHL